MDRRDFLKTAVLGATALGVGKSVYADDKHYPSKVDTKLFDTINRVKDTANKTPVEKKHAPVITAPKQVKAGEPFNVEVSIGEILHDMGPAHWIEYIELNIGNEPAGRVDFQPRGYLKPKAVFTVVLGQDFVSSGTATIVAFEKCNLHGYWESSLNINVTG